LASDAADLPRGTRLPIQEVPKWLDCLLLILVLMMLTGIGFLVWWFIEMVRAQ